MHIDDDVALDIFTGMVTASAPSGEHRLWRAAIARALIEDYLAKPQLFIDTDTLYYLADMADMDRSVVYQGALRLMGMREKDFWQLVKDYKGGSYGRRNT